MKSKALKGIHYQVIVDDQEITSFRSLTKYDYKQLRTIANDYSKRYRIPADFIKIEVAGA